MKSFKSRSNMVRLQHTILWTKQKNNNSQIKRGIEDIRLRVTSSSVLPITGPVTIDMEVMEVYSM